MFHLYGLTYARKLGLPSILDEILRTHFLFFGHATPSAKLMRTDFQGIEMDLISDYCRQHDDGIPSIHISDFPIYGIRLQAIYKRMIEWHPQSIRDLLHRPYGNTVSYYAFCFGFCIGLLNLAQLGLDIFNTIEGRKAGQNC